MLAKRAEVNIGIASLVPDGDLQQYPLMVFCTVLHQPDESIQLFLGFIGIVIDSDEAHEQGDTGTKFGQEGTQPGLLALKNDGVEPRPDFSDVWRMWDGQRDRRGLFASESGDHCKTLTIILAPFPDDQRAAEY